MVNHVKFAYRIGVAVLFVLLAGGTGWGAGEGEAASAEAGAPSVPGSADEKIVPEVRDPAPSITKASTLMDAYAGYRFLTVNRYGGRAAEYDYLRSNPVLGGAARHLGEDARFSLEGGYLNDRDYHGDFTYDFKGIYRFNLRTESLFHNLDHELLFSPPFTLSGNSTSPDDADPAALYGLRVEQDLVRFRYRFPLYPVHLNLGYWRMAREGSTQQRFADFAFGGTGLANTIFSRTRTVDRQTHEGAFGVDGHLGPLDIIYEFKIREFGEDAATPRASYSARPALNFSGGFLEHNENPDSRFYAHTIRLHTSMAGGIVGAASYTYGRRENRSSLSEVKGADQSRDTLNNVAGDFVYTPCKEFSLALKYRRQEIDRDNPATITAVFFNPQTLIVRPSLDTEKDVMTATLSVRPGSLLTFKGEYRGEFLHRDNVANADPALGWNLPENSGTHTGTVSVLSRPLKGLRLKALYSYAVASHPSYGDSFEERHKGELLATYNKNRWGGTVYFRAVGENNNQLFETTISPPPTFQPETVSLPRGREKSSADTTASLWFVPFDRCTVTGSYSLLRSKADQALLFTSSSALQVATNYTRQAQVYSINTSYRIDERLDISLALQQVRSFSETDPELKTINGGNSSGIKDVSRLKSVESSLSARIDYHLTRNFTSSVDYSFRDYDEKNSTLFDGSVNSVILYLAAKW